MALAIDMAQLDKHSRSGNDFKHGGLVGEWHGEERGNRVTPDGVADMVADCNAYALHSLVCYSRSAPGDNDRGDTPDEIAEMAYRIDTAQFL